MLTPVTSSRPSNPLRWNESEDCKRFVQLDQAILRGDGDIPGGARLPPIEPPRHPEPATCLRDVLELWELRPCFYCGSRKACEHRELDAALAEVEGLRARARWRAQLKETK